MQTRVKSGEYARYHFDSLSELGAYIANTPRKWRGNSSRDHYSSLDWDLHARYDACVDMARNGWTEGAQKLQEALKAFPPKTPAPDTRTDVYGFRPHVPRFCAGAPDSMIRHADVAETGAGRVLTLVVPINAMAHVDAEHMSNFGIAVTQYVNQLETDGTRVELIGAMVSTINRDPRCAHTWVIKKAEQPLDLAVVAFSMGHPGMFRRLGFALRERCDLREDRVYGQTVEALLSDFINMPPGTVILNGMQNADTYAPTPEKGLEYVSKQIDAALKAQEL